MDKPTLRETIIAQAEALHDEGKLSRQDVRRLRIFTAFPGGMKRIQEEVVSNAVAEKKLPANADPAGVDWGNLVDFIKEIIPLILAVIKLFSV